MQTLMKSSIFCQKDLEEKTFRNHWWSISLVQIKHYALPLPPAMIAPKWVRMVHSVLTRIWVRIYHGLDTVLVRQISSDHVKTNPARPSLTSVIGRELVYSKRYDANRMTVDRNGLYIHMVLGKKRPEGAFDGFKGVKSVIDSNLNAR